MTVITLPAGIVWATPQLGVAIVEGEPVNFPIGIDVPHLDFVAPQAWAQYDKPCETCDGTGNAPSTDWPPTLCPDCRDGRQVWELRTECDCDAGTNDGSHADDCLFDDDGYLPVARATVQVVPVVAAADKHLTELCVVVWRDRCELFNPALNADRWTPLPLDPLPTPGRDWAPIVALVEAN